MVRLIRAGSAPGCVAPVPLAVPPELPLAGLPLPGLPSAADLPVLPDPPLAPPPPPAPGLGSLRPWGRCRRARCRRSRCRRSRCRRGRCRRGRCRRSRCRRGCRAAAAGPGFLPGQDSGVLAEKDVQVGAGAQLVHGAGDPGGLQVPGAGLHNLVGGQRLIGRQAVAAQGGGAGVFAPQQHPGLLLGLLAAPPPRRGVGLEHGPADLDTELPGSQPVNAGQDHRLGGGRGGIIQDPRGLGDQLRLIGVDPPVVQGGRGQRQPGRQVIRQRQHLLRRPPRAGQRHRQLIGGELPGRSRDRPHPHPAEPAWQRQPALEPPPARTAGRPGTGRPGRGDTGRGGSAG